MNNSFAADAQLRLDRLLTTLAYGSRKDVQQLIRSGRVSLDGKCAKDPSAHVKPGTLLQIDGREIDARVTRHVMLHKPCGILTAARDAKQPTVLDLLPDVYRTCNCMPVGRLDKDTSGFLLLSTDGELAHRLLSPKREIWKCYEAEVDGPLSEKDIVAFQQGLQLSDFTALPARLEIIRSCETEACGRVWVCEGKFHQVRRMFASCGRTVVKLKRLTIGPLSLDESLQPGEYRELTDDELALLMQAVKTEKEFT